jgi:hypothetical protein
MMSGLNHGESPRWITISLIGAEIRQPAMTRQFLGRSFPIVSLPELSETVEGLRILR